VPERGVNLDRQRLAGGEDFEQEWQSRPEPGDDLGTEIGLWIRGDHCVQRGVVGGKARGVVGMGTEPELGPWPPIWFYAE
jgi:hypothetical protein